MKTVLIIEDDQAFRSVLAEYLKEHGWQVWEAGDGESGLALVKQLRPAAVLCDLLMPRVNGFQVCSAIRRDHALRHTHIVAISGKGFSANRAGALEAGADEFLQKPVGPGDVLAVLDRITTSFRPAEVRAAPLPTRHATLLKFWGVRGSIPTPGPATVFYGGNTSCVEVRADGEIIILDSGTGIRPLGLELAAEFKDRPLKVTILITHTHWDHIQGFPFFMPAYESKNHIRILGYEGAKEGLASIFSNQMEGPYFPIGLKELPGNIVIEEIKDLEFALGEVRVQAAFMNHPGICVGYRLFTRDGSIAYLPDTEPFYHLHTQPRTARPGDTSVFEFAKGEDQKLIEFIRGADVLIVDSQYDPDEYRSHMGWGHGCVDDVVSLALRGQVKRLYLFHHDPEHDDAKISQMVEHARKLAAASGGQLAVEAAREGERWELRET
jgi:phosphoribosyl 1,2-cyclic phosphodiesterase/CheY-like chemotaxis protein